MTKALDLDGNLVSEETYSLYFDLGFSLDIKEGDCIGHVFNEGSSGTREWYNVIYLSPGKCKMVLQDKGSCEIQTNNR